MNPKYVPCWWFQPLKNISQNRNLPQIWVKVKNVGTPPRFCCFGQNHALECFSMGRRSLEKFRPSDEVPSQFWGGCQVSNLKLRVKIRSSRKHVLVPDLCCKIHNNVWNYMIYIYIAHLLQQKKRQFCWHYCSYILHHLTTLFPGGFNHHAMLPIFFSSFPSRWVFQTTALLSPRPLLNPGCLARWPETTAGHWMAVFECRTSPGVLCFGVFLFWKINWGRKNDGWEVCQILLLCFFC